MLNLFDYWSNVTHQSQKYVWFKISATVVLFQCNSCDSNGVLEGRWSDKYPDDCTVPWKWTGSVPIIQEYHTNGNKPVRFGQCWVFSGLLTTSRSSIKNTSNGENCISRSSMKIMMCVSRSTLKIMMVSRWTILLVGCQNR